MKKVLLLLVFTLIMAGCSSSKKILKLKSDIFKIELGEEISDDLNTYLDLDNVSDKEKTTLLASQMDIDIKENNKISKEDKTFVKVGEYTGKITCGKEIAHFKVVISDTIKPVISGPDNLEFIQGGELNFDGQFTAIDLNTLEDFQYDTTGINKDEPGEYILKVSINDTAGNQTVKDVKVNIKQKEEIKTEDKESETTTTTPTSNSTNNNTQNQNNSTTSQSLAASLSASNNTTQLLTVIGTGGTTADFALHEYRNGVWTEVLKCNARVGTNGIGPTTEWSRTTPNGIFSLGMNFGMNSNPGATYGYTQVNSNHYWVDDVNSKYYNQFVDITKVDADWSSAEHIVEFPGYYNYCVNINYNPNCTPGVGSAIFIHCDTGTATYGCVAIPESSLATVMQRLQSDALIAIYPSYNSLY